MLSLVVTGPQIKEKQRGVKMCPPAYILPKYPSMNRVKCLQGYSFKNQYRMANHGEWKVVPSRRSLVLGKRALPS